MADVSTIPTQIRTAIGKRQLVRLRDEGLVPVVVYGQDGAPEHLSISMADLERELRAHNRVFVLQIDGKEQPVFLKDIHYDVLGDWPLHADLMRIDMDKPLSIFVELSFIGIPKGNARGGTLVKDSGKLAVNSMPALVPDEIEVKVGGVDLGDEILAKDVVLPEGTTLNCPPNQRICRMPL